MDYSWIRALHIFAVVVWISGVLMNGVILSLIARDPASLSRTALQRIHGWDRSVSNVMQGLVWVIGITLVVLGGWFPDGWLITKVLLVIFIAAIHGIQSATLRKLAAGEDVSSRLPMVRYSTYWVIGAILLIVLLVVLKPF